MASLRALIGERIKQVRKSKGLTLETLGEMAQMKSNYIGDVERGIRNISLDSLERLLSALEVDIRSLFERSYPLGDEQRNRMAAVLEEHQSYLKHRDVEEVLTIHRIAKEILETMDHKKNGKR